MSVGTLIVHAIERETFDGETESLEFRPGVNVIVGRPNVGKTKWLEMLDFVMGDNPTPQNAFGELADKYCRTSARATVGGSEVTLNRQWKTDADRHRVYVDGQPLNLKDYYAFLMERLGIPVVRYPPGDPLAPKTWHELNWRSLYRHMYRRQIYWADIADRQYRAEQHAAVLQFLGLAEAVFSDSFQGLAAAQRKVVELRAQKEEYVRVLNELSSHLLEQADADVALTPQGVEATIASLRKQIANAQNRRTEILEQLGSKTGRSGGAKEFDALSARLGATNDRIRTFTARARNITTRLGELIDYQSSLKDEAARLDRTVAATEILADVQVTHCPVCDQEVDAEQVGDWCHLCKRPVDPEASLKQARRRIEFERERLESETREADEMIAQLRKQHQAETDGLKAALDERERIRLLLRPVQAEAVPILPPDVAILDVQTGQLQQRIRQLDAVRASLAKRAELNRAIQEVESSIVNLEREVESERAQDFGSASDDLSDGMNAFVSGIQRRNPQSWTVGAITARVHASYFDFVVGRRSWEQSLGGTLRLYFLMAYHYALLSLTPKESRQYPGFAVLDFPPELEDGSSIADKENFVLEPFIELLGREEMAGTQLIAAGSAFEGLAGANRIELTHVWS